MLPLNRFHTSNRANSAAWGEKLGWTIELTLSDLEITARGTSPLALCCIAEAIMEHAGTADARLDPDALWDAAREASPRWRAAELAVSVKMESAA